MVSGDAAPGVPAITADTVADLADKFQIPAAELTRTIEEYNAACSDGRFDHSQPDGLSTTGLQPPKSNWARPLSEGPFHAYPITASNVFTSGGLKTDVRGRVLNRDGVVIGGLYAAGEITGLYYTNYAGSTSVMRGAIFGKIAGQDASAAINSSQHDVLVRSHASQSPHRF